MEWLANNWELVLAGWTVLVTVLEYLKRIIPGTTYSNVAVKGIDIGTKILTLGGSVLLPKDLPGGKDNTGQGAS